MADTEKTSKGLPTIAKVGIGCLVVLVLLGIIFTIAVRVLFTRIGAGLLKKGIETQTGIKMDTGKNGEFSITDSKTGASLNIGDTKLPADFPKDLPIYPNAKPTGSISGGKTAQDRGIWVTFSTPDDFAKVESFYTTNLKSKGWTVENVANIAGSTTWTIQKGTLAGTVMVNRAKEDKETTILVTLGSTNETPQPAEETPSGE